MKEKSTFIKFLVCESAVAALLVLVILLFDGMPDTLSQTMFAVIQILLIVFFAVICAAILLTVLVYTVMHIPLDAVHTSLELWFNRKIAKHRERNTSQIAPCLQNFLFSTMKRNNELLHLPLGDSIICLTPFGFAPVFRSDRVFYPFQLIVKDMPPLSEEQLKKLLNQFIIAELNNYGIPGLYSSYRYGTGQYYSVYVDRVIYDSDNNIITFELLFLGCDGDAEYLKRALLRDDAPPMREAEVYDDEV